MIEKIEANMSQKDRFGIQRRLNLINVRKTLKVNIRCGFGTITLYITPPSKKIKGDAYTIENDEVMKPQKISHFYTRKTFIYFIRYKLICIIMKIL